MFFPLILIYCIIIQVCVEWSYVTVAYVLQQNEKDFGFYMNFIEMFNTFSN